MFRMSTRNISIRLDEETIKNLRDFGSIEKLSTKIKNLEQVINNSYDFEDEKFLLAELDLLEYDIPKKIFSQLPLQPELSKISAKLNIESNMACLLYTSPSPRDGLLSRMPSSA